MEQDYLFTIKANHHYVYAHHREFKANTEDIGSDPHKSKQTWTHGVIAFPFKPKSQNDNDYKLKLGVNVLLPVSSNGQDIRNLVNKGLLTESNTSRIDRVPQVNLSADILTDNEIKEETELLRKLSKHKIIDGRTAFDFCESIFEDDNELGCIIDGNSTILKFNNQDDPN